MGGAAGLLARWERTQRAGARPAPGLPAPLRLTTARAPLPPLPPARRSYPEYSVTGVASKELESVISSMDQPPPEDEPRD